MRRVSERLRHGTLLCFLGGVFLLALVALTIGPPTAVAVESGENVTAYRASNAGFESAEAIEAAIANGTVDPADEVAVGDLLVVAIDSERLAESMNTTNGSATTRFFTVLDGDAEFRIVQTNPTPQKNRKFASIGPENVTVHRTGTKAYVVVETDDLTFRYRRVHRVAEIHGGERFAVQFGYDLPDGWSLGTDPTTPIIEFRPRAQLTTEQPRTTATSTRTASETAISTRTSSEEPTSEGASTTSEQANTTKIGEGRTEAPGVSGFTVLTMLGALLVLAVLWTQRS